MNKLRLKRQIYDDYMLNGLFKDIRLPALVIRPMGD